MLLELENFPGQRITTPQGNPYHGPTIVFVDFFFLLITGQNLSRLTLGRFFCFSTGNPSNCNTYINYSDGS